MRETTRKITPVGIQTKNPNMTNINVRKRTSQGFIVGSFSIRYGLR
jgi:hypothetical protein